ncbi:MAG: glycoside hydrolase family 13 protein [Oscillospiraceae bacterium]|nr:glycoside hydrolase family 13 protein [Oscillospiraceae bacterium]MCL2278682.1 glycoside hydrolase family 13 protein [Oscillospiraceae bacterium]
MKYLNKHAILHIPMSEYAHALSEKRVFFRLRAAKGDLKSCTLHYGDRSCRQNPVVFTPVEMTVGYSDLLFDWWEAEFDTKYRRICYYFELDNGHEKTLFYADMFFDSLSPERSEVYQLPFVHRADIAKAPDWAKDAVIYNIFPDSFATGRRYISGEPSEKKWNGEITLGKLGGTIKGITENADYFGELGVNCIYINPFFAAGQYHKYDLLDYFHVDPCFGTNEDFAEMVKTLKNCGIRVIIDGVFNHCGWRFFAFDDVVQNGRDSKYADWFYRLEFPVKRPETMDEIPNYECFAYERLMPKMNTENPEVIEYFCEVCRHWLREYGIDGWRLDVAEETNDEFWRSFKKAALEINPDVLLIGEIWTNANHWLDGTMFHSAMNYDFRKHCRDFFAKGIIDAEVFNSRITDMLTRYRKNLTYTQLNLLSSHDVSRFYSLCDEDRQRLKLSVLFQMCFIGIPSIYYGEEQGLTGITEDEYRRPMTWDGDGELFSFYKKAIMLRRDNPALRYGTFKMIFAEGQKFVFERKHNDKRVLIALGCKFPAEGSVLWESDNFIVVENYKLI